MKKLLAVFILAVCSWNVNAQDIRIEDPEVKAMVIKQVDTAWVAACLLKGMDCRNIPKPIVTFDKDIKWPLLGQYAYGTAQVAIGLRFYGSPYALVVMTHELIHYLQFIEGGKPLNMFTGCKYEEEAYTLANHVAILKGLTNHPAHAVWADMKDAYGCAPPKE